MTQPLTIWKVGSPHYGDTSATALPEDIGSMARDLGLACDVQAFPAKDFHLVFGQAVQQGRAPDVLVIDNSGILEGSVTPGTFTGIFTVIGKEDMADVSYTFDSLLGENRGWVWLINGSPQHEAALKMAHRRAPVPATWIETQSPPTSDIAIARSIARNAVEAYLRHDALELWPLLDPDHMMLHDEEHINVSAMRSRMYDVEIARIWGNDKLAFCGVVYTWLPPEYDSVGGGRAVVALRKTTSGDWRILFVARDPVTIRQLDHDVPELARGLTTHGAETVKPVQLIAPGDGEYPVPLPDDVLGEDDDDRFGFFEWQRDPASKPVAELVEFTSRDNLIGDTRVIILRTDLGERQGRISSGRLWSVGDRWQWRVWSIGADGSLALSSWREFYH